MLETVTQRENVMKTFTSGSVFRSLCLFIACSPLAHAHTFGAQGAGWMEGLAHPLLGLDHLLAMTAVGLWAGRLGGAAPWRLPLAFLAFMAGGALTGASGIAVPLVEPAVASSVLVTGGFHRLQAKAATSDERDTRQSVCFLSRLRAWSGIA